MDNNLRDRGNELDWLGHHADEEKHLTYVGQRDATQQRWYFSQDLVELDPDYSEFSVRIHDPRCKSLSFIDRTLAILPKSQLKTIRNLINAYLGDTDGNKKRRCKSCGKLFVPAYDKGTVKQMVCSNACCVVHYDKQKPKSKKLARLIAQMIGKRSMGEVRFDAEFIEPANLDVEYEPDSFKFKVEETCTYTPDFKVTVKKPTARTKGKVFYIEYKGVLDVQTRNKMKRVKAQHPTLDIRFVFQKANNKIRKGSKTTYGMWADQHGFIWADNCIPKGWLK